MSGASAAESSTCTIASPTEDSFCLGQTAICRTPRSQRDQGVSNAGKVTLAKRREACGVHIQDLRLERGHRTLRIMGKGSKPATIPLVPRMARTIDQVVGERSEGPILRRTDSERLNRRTAY